MGVALVSFIYLYTPLSKGKEGKNTKKLLRSRKNELG
jgi:hypothetical protein